MQEGPLLPENDCPLCPRLVAFRRKNRSAFPDFFNAPVPPFGEASARLLVVGLAPGLKGANRTGRPFTGDFAGDLLYAALRDLRFAEGTYGRSAGDGLGLSDCRITNAVRCVPPGNKPETPEIGQCNQFLAAEIQALESLRVLLALGAVAHGAVLKALGFRKSRFPFAHGAEHDLGPVVLLDSYHCSRYNTNTGRLTPAMFHAVLGRAREILDAG